MARVGRNREKHKRMPVGWAPSPSGVIYFRPTNEGDRAIVRAITGGAAVPAPGLHPRRGRGGGLAARRVRCVPAGSARARDAVAGSFHENRRELRKFTNATRSVSR